MKANREWVHSQIGLHIVVCKCNGQREGARRIRAVLVATVLDAYAALAACPDRDLLQEEDMSLQFIFGNSGSGKTRRVAVEMEPFSCWGGVFRSGDLTEESLQGNGWF